MGLNRAGIAGRHQLPPHLPRRDGSAWVQHVGRCPPVLVTLLARCRSDD